jgi:diaminopimelate decarboxylase
MQEQASLPYLSNAPSDLLVLAEKYGAPLYVYDAEIIQRQYERLKNAFQVPRLEINYACKALTNLSILKFIRRLGAGLDTVSIQEVHLGLEAGFQASQITFTPNCVAVGEIEEAWRLGVQINIDSIPVLEHFAQLHPEAPVCIRINPHIMAGGNLKTSVGHVDSKFGISVHQMPHVHRIVQATGIRVNGLHMHTGSDILNAEAFLEGAEILLECAREFPSLDYLDFGSGFKVPYKPGDIETDIEDLGKKLTHRFLGFCKSYGRELTLVFEPGKFLVSEAGRLLVKVNVVKNTTSTVFAGVDSGMNHLIRPMFYNAYHHISNVSNPNGTPRFYSVVGYICETDTFGVNRKIPEVREGDILCIHNAGAYAFSMSSNYNSRFRPAEVALYKGVDTLIRHRETMADILKNQTGAEL